MNKSEKKHKQAKTPGQMIGRGHGGMGMMPGEKARDLKGTLRRLVKYLGK
jgi:hypothetical protein